MHAPLSILLVTLLLAPAVAAEADAPASVPERCVGLHPASDLGLDACVDARDACTVRVTYTDKTGDTTYCA